MFKPAQIVSGGQTGADRVALDWAIQQGIPHGGWCPKGRLAEDGVIPDRYTLRETPSADPCQRTEWNVRDSDATLICSVDERLSGGSALTYEFCLRYGKPVLHLAGNTADPGFKLRQFVTDHAVRVLNVAGPRASEEPGIGPYVRHALEQAFGGNAG